MALIVCPECKRDVSDRARTCPHCGMAIAAIPLAAQAAPLAVGAGLGPLAVPASGAGVESVAWEGAPSARLMARELPGAVWALAMPAIFVSLLPASLRVVAEMNHEFKRVIAEQGSTIRSLVIGGAIVLSVLRLGRVALRYARVRATRYRLTNQRLTTESGLFGKRVEDIDLRMVEDVTLEQSMMERLLGLGRLTIVSTDRTRPRVQLYGIRAARDVRELLRTTAYAASQRQLFTRAT